MWRQEVLSQSGGSRDGGKRREKKTKTRGSEKPRELPDLLWGMREGGSGEASSHYLGTQRQEVLLEAEREAQAPGAGHPTALSAKCGWRKP